MHEQELPKRVTKTDPPADTFPEQPDKGRLMQNYAETCSFLNNSSLSKRQIRAIPYFIFARTIEEASRDSKISRNTFRRWWKNEAFREEFRKVREGIISEALGRLRLSLDASVNVLAELLQAEEKSIRLRAAEKIIENFFKIKEAHEFEERLEKIEAILFEQKGFSV